MAFYGRHKVYVMFWTWSIGPFFCHADLKSMDGGISVGGMGSMSLRLYPRRVPQTTSDGRLVRSNRGYLDVLRPNDWVFVFVDPNDGGAIEPIFSGFIDSVLASETNNPQGVHSVQIDVKCSSWEKAINIISAISDPWVSRYINQATMLEIALRGTNARENQDTSTTRDAFMPNTGRAIANIVEVFLRADQSEAVRQQMAEARGTTREDLERAEFERLLGLSEGSLEELDPSDPYYTPPAPGDDAPIQSLMGQFQLPRSDPPIPLWNLIRMRFESLGEYTIASPHNIAGQLNRPLVQFIDEWSNPLINAVIYDTRRVSNDGLSHLSRTNRLDVVVTGGYTESVMQQLEDSASDIDTRYGRVFEDVAPHMIFMKRPLFADELLDLEGPTIRTSMLSNYSAGFSDSDLHNMSYIELSAVSGPNYRMISGLTGFDANRQEAIESIRRHGLRVLNQQTNSWPDPRGGETPEAPALPIHDPEIAREWNVRMQRSGLDAVKIKSGSAKVKKYIRGLFLGGRIVLINDKTHPGVHTEQDHRVYYVDGIGWSYDASNGAFLTDIALTRGYRITQQDIERADNAARSRQRGAGGIGGASNPHMYGR